MSSWRALWIGWCSVAIGLGCERSAPPAPAAMTTSSAGSPQPSARIAALRIAEDERDAASVGERDLASADPAVRRAAARALARIASEEARTGLLRLLADEDPEVVAFAAYGLGWTCAGHEAESTSALVARAPSLPAATGRFDPTFATARALGRCGTVEAEQTLAAWVRAGGARASSAALGLGDVATKRKLKEDTVVALATAAGGSAGDAPIANALFPFTRADAGDASAVARVRDVAIAALAKPGDTRIFAIRALGRTDESATGELLRVLTTAGSFTEGERAEAARSLGRLGDKGQRALADALGTLLPGRDKVSLSGLVSDTYGPLATALDAMHAPAPRHAKEPLSELASLPIDDGAPPSLARRLARLRCAAARLLASTPDDPRLLACDPTGGDEGDLARVAALSATSLDHPKRKAAIRALASAKSAKVRSAAFDVLAAHPEDDDAAAIAKEGLSSPHGGTVSAAAQLVAARGPAWSGDPAKIALVGPALSTALSRTWNPDDAEIVASLVTAAGALHLASEKPKLEKTCADPSPTLRAAAKRALELLGDKDAKCAPHPRPAPAPELDHVPARAKIVFDTDAGELAIVLDPDLAPTATTRFVDLARAGFYDDMTIHRVVPAFVVQLGDKAGDGTGGAGKDALRCETSPLPFAPLSVGVALAGRDTGSSQLFVTLSRTPHLDGEYALVGTATGDWAAVAEGDRIRKARVVE